MFYIMDHFISLILIEFINCITKFLLLTSFLVNDVSIVEYIANSLLFSYCVAMLYNNHEANNFTLSEICSSLIFLKQ